MKVPGRVCVADGLSTRADAADASREALESVADRIGANPDLALVFITPHHAAQAHRVLEDLRGILGADVVVGCTASGVIGAGREVQSGPGLAVWSARLPGTRVQGFHLRLEETEEGNFVRGWPEVGPDVSAVLLGDPFSFPVEPFLASLRREKKAPTLVGGLASGATRPGGNRFFMDDRVFDNGAVGFVIAGPMRLQPLVSQGCKPVGKPFVVTRCERNVIYELGGAPAYDGLGSVLAEMDEDERRRFSRAPQVGLRAASDPGSKDGSGGYLIRGLMGVDRRSGAVAVTDHVYKGLELQFHTRDGASAHEELQSLLALASALNPESEGALLFCCNGRGVDMFDSPDHDVGEVRTFFPGVPAVGMFAAGEIGPVLGQPYLHSFTASLGFLVQAAGG
ncbi:MAG: hypothetical protein EYC70_09875 [Planctomycetota bacterium]|nr:MAG: hypothetical protein EYC70_09875 [Planctomycetota bacterium]